jgi:hypothetical protein
MYQRKPNTSTINTSNQFNTMKYRNSFAFVSIMFFVLISLQELTGQVSSRTYPVNDPLTVGIVDGTAEHSVLRFHFDAFHLEEVKLDGKTYHRIALPGAAAMLETGAPEVLLTARSVIIPDDGRMAVTIQQSAYQDFPNIDLLPSKGNILRDTDPQDVPYNWGPVYQQDRFWPGEVATLRDPYILRDYRGQTVVVQPFQYNPVTRTLRVYYDITVEVSKAESGGLNTFERSSRPTAVSEEFYQIYNRHFLNFSPEGILYTPLEETGNMLVICHGPFMGAMLDFVRWKNQNGIPTEMVDVSTIGTTAAAIKTFVTNYYNTHGLTYLLLVGDAAQIPTNQLSSGHSDNAYAYLVGNDSYPELFVGRFSAETVGHVETQVVRTLTYEINPDTVGGWFEKSIGIASDEGPGHYGEMDYQHVRYMQADLLGNTYTHNLEFFEGSQGGNDAPGNPNATMVSNAVNAGAGIMLYTGHGSTTSWATSGFSNTSISGLSNHGRWPFIWSVACVNGNFVNSTCFAESWLRAADNDQPTGAVAMFASTVNQSWSPPMEGQDEMVDILVESYTSNIKRSFGGLSINGCMKMNDVYGNAGEKETDHWTIFGDPSVYVRTMTPSTLVATHPPVAILGATSFSVFTGVNGARATLSLNGEILGSGIIAASHVTINYTSPLMPDTMDLVVSAFNHIPYIVRIPVIVPNNPYLVYQSHAVNDHQSNSNQQADFGETFSLDLTVENVGQQPAGNVTLTLRSNDSHIEVIDSVATIPSIQQQNVQLALNLFSLRVSDSVPNGHNAAMELVITDGSSNQWVSFFNIQCHAPVLVIDTLYINDLVGGNGNGKLEPGEVGIVHAVVRNIGGAAAQQHLCSMVSNHTGAALFGNTQLQLGHLPLYSPVNLQFFARIDTAMPMGSVYRLDLDFVSGAYSATAHFEERVLKGDEDFETGDFQMFDWQHSGNSPWIVSTQSPYEGTYSARSGVIGHSAHSSLSVDWHAAYPDTISFWLRVSCENGSLSGQKWDHLEFYINGISQDWWDGNKPWFRVAYPVPAGQHTFTWKYQKDAYAIGGSDAAWIDMIKFPAAGGAVSPKPFMLMEWVQFSDHNGNNDGILNAGEVIDIAFMLNNIGMAPANQVNGQLTTANSAVNMVNPSANLGNYPAETHLQTGYVMQVGLTNAITMGQEVLFDLQLTDDQSHTWSYPFTLVAESAIGIEKEVEKSVLHVYPNPFRDMLHVDLPEAFQQEKIRLQLFTIDGRLVLDELYNQPGAIITLKTGDLSAGAFTLRMIASENVLTTRVIRR